MTRAPYVMAKPEAAWDRGDRESSTTRPSAGGSSTRRSRRCTTRTRWARPPRTSPSAGRSAATGRTRSRSRSQQKAVAAIEAGRFDDQIVPITVPQKKGDPVVVARDEHPRADTSARGAREAPARVPRGRHGDRRQQLRASTTAPRRCCSSRRSGPARWAAAAGPGRLDRRRRRRPGDHGRRAGAGRPQGARPGRDRRRRPRPGRAQRGVRSASRSCASTSSGWIPTKVNVNGGAIALGHPLGMSGAPAGHDAQPRAAPDRRALRPRDDVHRGRAGDRHGHRAHRGLSRATGRFAARRVASISPSGMSDAARSLWVGRRGSDTARCMAGRVRAAPSHPAPTSRRSRRVRVGLRFAQSGWRGVNDDAAVGGRIRQVPTVQQTGWVDRVFTGQRHHGFRPSRSTNATACGPPPDRK